MKIQHRSDGVVDLIHDNGTVIATGSKELIDNILNDPTRLSSLVEALSRADLRSKLQQLASQRKMFNRPPTHMWNEATQLPLCGETKEPIYLSDENETTGRVTCFACLSLLSAQKSVRNGR